MKVMVCSLRECTLGRAAAVACCVAAFAPGMARGQTLISYNWTGSTSTAFGTTTNWNPETVAPSGGSFSNSRLTVGAGSAMAPVNELVYSSAQGTTTYINTGTFNQSGLFIGAFSGALGSGFSASMRITGGSFTSNTERADGMASIGNGTLTIAGGAYTKTGLNSDFGVKWQGTGTGTLNVESGSFTAGRIVYGAAGTGGGAGVVNLTGGTTTVNQILEVIATSSTLNLNGGTLRAGANESNFITVDQALVSAGGAVIDTQGFAVTIAQALVENGTSPGGGLTKLGTGTLTLSSSNSHTGGTVVSAGTLALNATGGLLGAGAIDIAAAGTLNVTALGTLALGTGQGLGGAGTILGSLLFDSGSSLIFSETDTLTLSGGVASFFAGTPGSRFGIDNLTGISSSTPAGTYTLITGVVDFTNLDNVGVGAAYALGGGKTAYFHEGSLQVVVVPEPGTVSLAAAAALVGLCVARRRR